MIKLSKEQVLELHSQIIKTTGGTDGLRDEGMLDSALNAPFQVFDEISLFPSIMQKKHAWVLGLFKTILL